MWSSDSQAIKFVGRSVVLICEGKDFKLTSLDGVHTVREELAEIDSTQEESDSRIVLYCQYAKKKNKKKNKATSMLLSRVLIQMSSSSLCTTRSGLKTLAFSLRQEEETKEGYWA